MHGIRHLERGSSPPLPPYRGLSFDTGLGPPSASLDWPEPVGTAAMASPHHTLSPDTFRVVPEIVWSSASVIRGNRANNSNSRHYGSAHTHGTSFSPHQESSWSVLLLSSILPRAAQLVGGGDRI